MKSMTISINWTLDLVHRESTGLGKADTRWVSRIRGIDDINQFVGKARYYILIKDCKDKHFLSVQSHAQWITRSVYWESRQYNLRFHVVFMSRNIVLWICCLSFMLKQFGLLWLEVRFTTITVHDAQYAGALDLNDCDPSWAVQWECQRPFKKPTPFFLTMDVSHSLSLFFFSWLRAWHEPERAMLDLWRVGLGMRRALERQRRVTCGRYG